MSANLAAMDEQVTTSLILHQLPRIVAEHRALVSTLGLHNVVSHRASFLVDTSNTDFVSLPDAVIGDIFDSYLTECERQEAYHAAVAIALCENVKKVHKVKDIIPLLPSDSFEQVLQVLTKRGHWTVVLGFVESRPDEKLHNLLKDTTYASAICTNPQLKECFELLLMRCSDLPTLTAVAERLTLECRGVALAKLMAREDVDLAQLRFYDTNGWPLNLLGLVTRCLVSETRATNRSSDAAGLSRGSSGYRSLLIRTVQAGLTSQQTPTCQHVDDTVSFRQRPTPLVTSALNGLLDLVKLFHRTGATTNKELFQLRTHQELTAHCGQDFDSTRCTRRQEVVDYISQAARHPRRLQDLCVFRISQCLGCRSDRARRAGKLPVTEVMRHQILFQDVLHEYLA